MKMKIIGHRGAAGLALENTLESIRAGVSAGSDALEFDVRLTKDHRVVLCHDNSLKRIAKDNRLISELSLNELQAIELPNSEHVPLLSEVLEIVGSTPVIIEIKVERMVRHVLNVIDAFPNAKITIASFKHREMALMKELRPSIKVYVAARTAPLEIIYIARAIEADGIDLNFWLLNPLTYLLARRSKLDIMVYTIDRPLFARFIHVLYPRAAICTNNPQNFTRKRGPSNARHA